MMRDLYCATTAGGCKLFRFGRIWPIDYTTARETGAHRTRRNQLELRVALRVQLDDGARAASQTGVQRVEKVHESFAWRLSIVIGLTQPLHCRNTGSEWETVNKTVEIL